MDNRVVTTVRLPADLAARAKEYARHRDVTLTVLMEAALRNLLHDAEGGVPDVPTIAEELEAPHISSVREMKPAKVKPKAPTWHDYAMERQQRLNKGRG